MARPGRGDGQDEAPEATETPPPCPSARSTYKLGYELYAHAPTRTPQNHGTSTNEFRVTDRADVAFDPTF